MEHLSIDEMIEFVSANEISGRSMELAKKVNGHIRICTECFEKLRAIQMIYDEFKRLGKMESFKKFLRKQITSKDGKNTKDLEYPYENKEFGGYR